jgi:hypothetical protein
VISFLIVLTLIIAGVVWKAATDSPAGQRTSNSQVNGPAASPTSAPPDGSVFVAPPELLGSWVDADGSTGYEFRADGTYTLATLDSTTG